MHQAVIMNGCLVFLSLPLYSVVAALQEANALPSPSIYVLFYNSYMYSKLLTFLAISCHVSPMIMLLSLLSVCIQVFVLWFVSS